MRLYHHPMSSNARRAVMTALQLGTPVELVSVDLAKGEQRQPDYLRLNPTGRVPVLDDDGFVLWESNAIMQYLAERTPEQTLYPTELRARADVNRWQFWSAHHLAPSVGILGWERLVKPMLGLGTPEPKLVARGEELVRQCVTLLDQHLAGSDWIAQGRLTLADISICTPFMITRAAQLPVQDRPHFAAWFERMRGLDAWKKTDL